MIMAKMKPCTLMARTSGVDDYKQPHMGFSSTNKTVDVSVSMLAQNIFNDVRYKDATHLGLTLDKTLQEGNAIVYGSTTYLIQLVNNDGRMTQLILKKL